MESCKNCGREKKEKRCNHCGYENTLDSLTFWQKVNKDCKKKH